MDHSRVIPHQGIHGQSAGVDDLREVQDGGTEGLCSHWSSKSQGYCQLTDSCNIVEDITHILQIVPALDNTRVKLAIFTDSYIVDNPEVKHLIEEFCTPYSPNFSQFLIDCSILPPIIASVQEKGSTILHQLFTLTRYREAYKKFPEELWLI